ncbi:helix-turn-helix domain-containing protein [Rhodococcus triatomae]|uniref:DNA binding domain-containing protein, excisionase family n=1 Tax=Rhodococcus triatomae TaxID=300028 RepID=A0A1G8H401_9NOCA|nr:helix-turn-helix domain-containing protein [Rhodococcus triatomae]QNG20216.1 helix-turn-helix domain-containing protein [Rhodococcus triatomae]QNG23869.1 helix-turn-helix domain-containing protein [Rhodococcus triatomae]SDI01291.1 DNA binding domain-containing protein, excisionase family [Rhodococcus triatomae]
MTTTLNADALEQIDPHGVEDVDRDEIADNRMLTLAEACDYLSVSRATIYRAAIAGKVTIYRIMGSRNATRVRFTDVEALLEPVDVSDGSTAHPTDRANRAAGTSARKQQAQARAARRARDKADNDNSGVAPEADTSRPVIQGPRRRQVGKWQRTTCPECGLSAAYSPINGRIALHYLPGAGLCTVGHRVDQTAVFIPLDDKPTEDVTR